MKTLTTVLAALIATTLPSVLSAQQPDQPREIQRRLVGFRGQITLLQALDTDGDREISADEMEKAGIVLAKLDANKDGKLTIRELLMPRPDAFTRAAIVFERLDANDDGKLSADEIPEGMQRLIERADTDDDGVLTKEEFEGAFQRRGFGEFLRITNSLPIGRNRSEK